jgi:hypothetical protein
VKIRPGAQKIRATGYPASTLLLGRHGAGIAHRPQARHDSGSQYVSDDFETVLKFLGIASSPAFVRESEGNEIPEHVTRTLPEAAALGPDVRHRRRSTLGGLSSSSRTGTIGPGFMDVAGIKGRSRCTRGPWNGWRNGAGAAGRRNEFRRDSRVDLEGEGALSRYQPESGSIGTPAGCYQFGVCEIEDGTALPGSCSGEERPDHLLSDGPSHPLAKVMVELEASSCERSGRCYDTLVGWRDHLADDRKHSTPEGLRPLADRPAQDLPLPAQDLPLVGHEQDERQDRQRQVDHVGPQRDRGDTIDSEFVRQFVDGLLHVSPLVVEGTMSSGA